MTIKTSGYCPNNQLYELMPLIKKLYILKAISKSQKTASWLMKELNKIVFAFKEGKGEGSHICFLHTSLISSFLKQRDHTERDYLKKKHYLGLISAYPYWQDSSTPCLQPGREKVANSIAYVSNQTTTADPAVGKNRETTSYQEIFTS